MHYANVQQEKMNELLRDRTNPRYVLKGVCRGVSGDSKLKYI